MFRLATAVPIGLAFSQLFGIAGDDSGTSPYACALAFTAGAFPFRDVNRLIRQKVVQFNLWYPKSSKERRLRGYLGETLQGFNHETVIRLEELGIATVLDMAYADPVRLMLKTGKPIRQVISWLDESLLAVYAGPRTGDFARLGIPCSIDVVGIWGRYTGKSPSARLEAEKVVESLAESLKVRRPLLEDLLRRIADDPQVQFIASVWEFGGTASQSIPAHGQPGSSNVQSRRTTSNMAGNQRIGCGIGGNSPYVDERAELNGHRNGSSEGS